MVQGAPAPCTVCNARPRTPGKGRTMHEGPKRKWLARLRDPESKQTTNRLGRQDGGRCCLGVLCDVAVAEGIIPAPQPSSLGLLYGIPSDSHTDVSWTSLPPSVQQWAGLDDSDPFVADAPLSVHNDERDKTFAEIADMIEEEL